MAGLLRRFGGFLKVVGGKLADLCCCCCDCAGCRYPADLTGNCCPPSVAAVEVYVVDCRFLDGQCETPWVKRVQYKHVDHTQNSCEGGLVEWESVDTFYTEWLDASPADCACSLTGTNNGEMNGYNDPGYTRVWRDCATGKWHIEVEVDYHAYYTAELGDGDCDGIAMSGPITLDGLDCADQGGGERRTVTVCASVAISGNDDCLAV